MKKTNKISNVSKKVISGIAFASGLMIAALPGKAKADLLNVNAGVDIPGIAGVGVGANVGNGVNAGVRAQVLGIGAGVGVSALSCPTYTYGTVPARRVTYITPTTTYVPATTTYVANPDVVYRTVPTTSYRPAPVVYQTAPVAGSGEVVVKETYDAYSRETENSEFSHQVWTRSEDNPIQRYRTNETHSRKVTKQRRVYYTYE